MLTAIERSTLKLGTFIDLAASTKTSADYTVIATCGKDADQNVFILNILRGRWEWPDTREYFITEILNQKVKLAGVEKPGFGLSAVQDLARDPRLSEVALKPVDVDADKTSRSLLLSARGAAGKLYYDRKAVWSEELKLEFTNFPLGRHDDMVDAVTGCLALLNQYNVEVPIVIPGMITRTSKWRRGY